MNDIRDSLAQVLADIRRAAKAHEIKKDRPGASIDVTEWHVGWDEGATYAADVLEAWLEDHGPELMKMLDRHGAGDAEDSARLDWMERHVVEVREPLRHGSAHMFYATQVNDEGELYRSNLRVRVDAARAGERG